MWTSDAVKMVKLARKTGGGSAGNGLSMQLEVSSCSPETTLPVYVLVHML